MPNVAVSSNASQLAPSAALSSFASPRKTFDSSNSSCFSQIFSGTKDVKLRPTIKPSPTLNPHTSEPKSETAPSKARRSGGDSSSQAPVTPAAVATPVANPPSISAPTASAQTSDAEAEPNPKAMTETEPVVRPQNAIASEAGVYLPANTAIAKQQTIDASNSVPDARASASSSTQRTIEEFEKTMGCPVFDASSPVDAPVRTRSDVDAATTCSADSPVNTPNTATSSAPQAQGDATVAAAAIVQGNRATQQPQTNAVFGTSTAQASNTPLSLPSAITLISATAAGGDETALAKANLQNRQNIAQRIQPALPNLDAALANGPQAIQSSLVSEDNGRGGNSSGGSPAQSGGHSMDQAQRDSKPSGARDSSQTSTQFLNGPASGPQNSSTANAASAAGTAAFGTQSAHIAAHAAAQTNASGESAAATKSLANGPSVTNQPSLPSSPITPSLPRSLSDVNQAAQLYQQIGRAEMHISMDTDALGSIDLRAVVHQGTLSATIGVQRADVQTLLVNELPALQHSLAEKNFQVNHISVLAGSIGSGANPNGQRGSQQHQRQAAPAFTSLFRDVPSPAVSRAHLNEVAALVGKSARLSVIA